VTVVRAKEPDVVLTDLRMPETDKDAGLRAALRIRQDRPAVGVILLSAYGEAEYAAELLQELPDRVGYVLKDHVDDVPELIRMMERVAAGGIAVDPRFVGRLLGRARRDNPLDRLSAQERNVLGLVAEGLSNNAIARRLRTTDSAVEKAITGIRRKLGLTGIDSNARVNVVLAYLRYTGQLRPADEPGASEGQPARGHQHDHSTAPNTR
jgi:DNA-binding NarL/FixJ family response regulator